MEVEGLTRVATYRREVRASAERVWENVRDWEHLPWLHNESFASIDHQESGDWGWRVSTTLAPPASRTISLELLIDASQSRYVTRTTAGVGVGSEIWTCVEPVDAERTAIEVEFHLPGVSPEQATALGGAYTALYTKLWDEDEQMMQMRESRLASLAAPIPNESFVDLGPEQRVRSRVPIDIEFGGRPYKIVELDGDLQVYSAVCPHLLGPLGNPDADAYVSCPWHGWRFDLRTGRACGGERARLLPTPRLVVDPENSEVSLRFDS